VRHTDSDDDGLCVIHKFLQEKQSKNYD